MITVTYTINGVEPATRVLVNDRHCCACQVTCSCTSGISLCEEHRSAAKR